MSKIRIAIVGIGNCASSLIQGIHFYQGKNEQEAIGLMHWEIGGYQPGDIDLVAAFFRMSRFSRLSGFTALTYLYKLCAETLSRSATSATEYP